MRCVACGAAMILMKVDRNDTMVLLGCEHHAFRCLNCNDLKWCLAFIRHGREIETLHMPTHPAPPIVPVSPVQDVRKGLLRRLAAKMRSN